MVFPLRLFSDEVYKFMAKITIKFYNLPDVFTYITSCFAENSTLLGHAKVIFRFPLWLLIECAMLQPLNVFSLFRSIQAYQVIQLPPATSHTDEP